jgi:hypothetical protein
MVEDGTVDSGSDGVVVLGGELAAAEAAEQRHVPPGPSPIAGVDYPDESGDLWRPWVERPEDSAMSVFVGSYAAAGEPDRVVTRACLTMDDLYTVLLFARRRALAAIRTGDPHAAVEAFDALSAIDIERVDWRDAATDAMFAAYAAPYAGIPATEAAEGAIGRADPQMAEVLSEAVNDDEEIDLAESCGYRVVTTADGPALFDDESEPYEPDRDLVPIALGVAAAIEGEHTYLIDTLTVAEELPLVWVVSETDPQVEAAIGRLTGCVSIRALPVAGAGPDPNHHYLNIYLAEAATAEDAATIARGAARGERSRSAALGIAAGRLCAVLIAATVGTDQPPFETAESLARFQAPISALLD